MTVLLDRRGFTRGALAGAAFAALPAYPALARAAYTGPKIIIVRFGGGVRRRETIDPTHTHAPYLRHILAKRGTLFPLMEIESAEGVKTGHGQGTLNILTGKYEAYQDVRGELLGERFEASVPTLFEYLRKAYAVPAHQALIVNGEDRAQEEFFTFGNHHLYGARYRSEVLSLYRYKTHLLRRTIARHDGTDAELAAAARRLSKLEAIDYRRAGNADGADGGQVREIENFWEDWRRHFGQGGLINPRGDGLLTELAVRAMRTLQPSLMMVNYQDPDYVHWGNPAHYTRGVAIIDRGIERLVAAAGSEPAYRDNTVFVIVPDCGRDSNTLMAVPYQHHFGSRSAHEIWALIVGPGVAKNQIVDRVVQQSSIAATVGRLMGVETRLAEGSVLGDALL
ncbi:MAG: hypothetical protein OEU46_09330 [Alphaproteobacteria bacterium]|nr:hypothetical protein [Alphaproteobacteria bacterium]